MNLLINGLLVLAGGGFCALLLSRTKAANVVGAISAVVGSAMVLVPAVRVIAEGSTPAEFSAAWNVPYGSFTLLLDPLSAWFVIPIAGLSAICAVYGLQYMAHYAGRKSLGAPWFFYNLLVASMVVVVTSRNGVLFLVAWECMALTSYFLVVFEDEKDSVQEAGRIYLIASHLGTAFLLAFFVLLGREAGSLEFSQIATWLDSTDGFSPGMSSLLFILALVGFGTKAGFMPLHVWLPEAHPAAPTHVSAVMSGVMIKTGIYGIVRTLTVLGSSQEWWGWLLIGVGVTSGIGGILFALAQHDLKRLLAYSSVENVGIIALGLGIGVLGVHGNAPAAALLGFSGALLHVLNHAVFKGLLFLGAGAVIQGTGTGVLDVQGGLLKRMPWTGVSFLVGAAAISGLPPLNGFFGEFLMFLGAFEEDSLLTTSGAVTALAAIGSLALIGGLAAACFTKAFGIVFLGEPRSDASRDAHPPGWAMRVPMLLLAGCCFGIALLARPIVERLVPIVSGFVPEAAINETGALDSAFISLSSITTVCVMVVVLGVVLTFVRKALLKNREIGSSSTWGCGYAAPTVRMQYTSSSFAFPILALFSPMLRIVRKLSAPRGLFPKSADLHTEAPDIAMKYIFSPLYRLIDRLLSMLGWIQHGQVHLYVLYIAVTMVVLLVWYLGVAA